MLEYIKISIVIPAYNCSSTIDSTIDSALESRLGFEDSVEILVVNDGSTDDTLLRLNNRAHTANLTVVSHRSNYGLSRARKTGISMSRGNYVLSLDADDTLEPSAISTLVKLIDNSPDIILYNYNFEFNGKRKAGYQLPRTYSSKYEIIHFFMGAVWTKLVRRDLLNDLVYYNYKINTTEDLIYSLELYIKAKYIYICNDKLYNYKYNPNSLSVSVKAAQYIRSQNIVFDALKDITIKYKLETAAPKILNYVLRYLIIFLAESNLKSGASIAENEKRLLREKISAIRGITLQNKLRLRLSLTGIASAFVLLVISAPRTLFYLMRRN